MIIIEWEESNWEWYIIKSGRVAIWINWNRIAELNAWGIFWEIALLNEEERTATVTAIDDIEVIVLSIDNLVDMINNDDDTINKTIMTRIEENINR
jgi:CRP-like cAMP-binding protein